MSRPSDQPAVGALDVQTGVEGAQCRTRGVLARCFSLPHRAARTLITGGVFRLSRNPIYLAFALLHLACALSLGSPGMLLMLVAVLWVMHSHVIAAEEAFHAQRFGAQWQAYRQRVRRWL